MRATTWILGTVLVWVGLCAGSGRARAQGTEGSAWSAEGFRALLAPHGEWVTTRAHGELFVPREGREPDFAPYLSGGRWEERDAGLAFVSIYAWGEVCFHQGRWVPSVETGTWAWIPGREHASAWVEWRRSTSTDEVAWRPLAPRGATSLRWFVASRSELGSPRLASLARVVDEARVASFARGELTTLRDASPMHESDPTAMPRVPPGQVVLSGGGRIVVHGPSGDRVLRVEPVIVSRATAEEQRAERARREEERRERERVAAEERSRREAARRERDTLAAAERAAVAAERAEQAAAEASARSAAVSATPRCVSVWPYGPCNPALGPCITGYGVGVARSYGYGALAPSPEPVAPSPPPPPPPAPRPTPAVGAAARSTAFARGP
jgi:hypothetical protein